MLNSLSPHQQQLPFPIVRLIITDSILCLKYTFTLGFFLVVELEIESTVHLPSSVKYLEIP